MGILGDDRGTEKHAKWVSRIRMCLPQVVTVQRKQKAYVSESPLSKRFFPTKLIKLRRVTNSGTGPA